VPPGNTILQLSSPTRTSLIPIPSNFPPLERQTLIPSGNYIKTYCKQVNGQNFHVCISHRQHAGWLNWNLAAIRDSAVRSAFSATAGVLVNCLTYKWLVFLELFFDVHSSRRVISECWRGPSGRQNGRLVGRLQSQYHGTDVRDVLSLRPPLGSTQPPLRYDDTITRASFCLLLHYYFP